MVLNVDSSLNEWLDWIEASHPRNIAMGLDRTRRVAQRLKITKPQCRVITVAGTNGKGSSVSMIEKGLNHLGMTHVSYTSPHFHVFNERIRRNGISFNDQDIITAFAAIRDAAESFPATPLTYFEYSTLAAIWLAIQAGVDYLILEVGLGGRLDAVNIIDADYALLTNVGLDHLEYLGDTREAIGFEKAGVFRPRQPAVVGELDVPKSVIEHAHSINASIARLGYDFDFRCIGDDQWEWQGAGFKLTNLPLPHLAVPLQNIASVLYLFTQMLVLSEQTIRLLLNELLNTRMPGRFQSVTKRHTYYFDVAHNAESAAVLLKNILALPEPRRIYLVLGMLRDKPVEQVIMTLENGLAEFAEVHWHLAGLPDVYRGLDVTRLHERAHTLFNSAATKHDTVAAALNYLVTAAKEEDCIVVFGSFHTVAKGLHELDVSPCFD